MTPARGKKLEQLLRFAIDRIARETRCLYESHVVPSTGRIYPASIAREIRENRTWLTKARRAVRK